MLKRIAQFEKVSPEQLKSDFVATYNNAYKAEDVEIILPTRSTKGSAGYDFVSPIDFNIAPGGSFTVVTGVRCKMKDGWVLMIYPRSGMGFKYQCCLANTVGVIDASYYGSDNEGHIMVKLVNRGDKIINVKAGDKFCQGVFTPYGITKDDNVSTKRNGGFGSTGA